MWYDNRCLPLLSHNLCFRIIIFLFPVFTFSLISILWVHKFRLCRLFQVFLYRAPYTALCVVVAEEGFNLYLKGTSPPIFDTGIIQVEHS